MMFVKPASIIHLDYDQELKRKHQFRFSVI